MPPKRKSDTALSSSSSKKAHTDTEHAPAAALVTTILADRDNFPIDDDDDKLRDDLIALAEYARYLQGRAVASAASAAVAVAAAPKQKSPEELQAAAERIRKAAVAGIKKQMVWRSTCKGGRAKWVYDGICPDPDVFGAVMGLGGPPTFKMKKFPKDDFQTRVGRIHASARYSNLYLTGTDVNVRWSDTGEFKFSGTYGCLG